MGKGVVWADMSNELRQRLATQKGPDRLVTLEQLYYLSQDSDDINYQMRCIDEFMNEARRQDSTYQEGYAMSLKAVLFYNNDMNDSVFNVIPHYMERAKAIKSLRVYYELWAHIANTYVFMGKNGEGIMETKAMYEDAKKNNENFGMGLAYCIMGTAYTNLRDFEESINSFEKSIGILSAIKPLPPVLPDAYGYYSDALNSMKAYQKMDSLTVSWEQMLKQFIVEHQLEGTATVDLYWFYYYLACAQAAIGQNQVTRAAQMIENMEYVTPSEESYRGRTLLYYKAQLAILQGDYQQALTYNERRYQLMSGNSDQSGVVNVNFQRADIFNHLGRYKEAAGLFRTVYLISDSLNQQDTKRNLNAMNTMFGLTEMEREKERLVIEQEREKERMTMEQKQTQMRWIIAVAVLVVLSLAVFLFFRIRAARKLRQAHGELQVAYDDLQAANRVIEETTAVKERIESELRIARDIQMSMVPTMFPERDDLDLYASMTPAKEVGGDLYDFLIIEKTSLTESNRGIEPSQTESNSVKPWLYFCVGDVSGKGVPASLFMAQATRLFRTLAKQQMQPAEIATRLNAELAEDNEQGMFVTMFLGVVDLQTGHLDFCNAGHNPPVLAGKFMDMEPNAPIGLWPGLEYVGESIDNISGDLLFIYTDGLNEAENEAQEQFGDDHLLELFQDRRFDSARQTVDTMKEEVARHVAGAEPSDDLTMMCVMIKCKN